MKRIILLLGCLGLMAIHSGNAQGAGSPLEIAKYFPPDATVFARTPDLKMLLTTIQSHPLTKLYLKSEDDQSFRQSRVTLKLVERFKDVEKLSGIKISIDHLMQIAGRESAFALYDIGGLDMVFITEAPREKVLASQFGAMKDKFEERKKGGQTYYVITDESGAAFAFAMVDGRLIVSNNLKLFDRSLDLVSGQAGDNLANSPQFKAAIPDTLKAGDLTIVLDQESLNDNLYFNNYWIHRNGESLAWVKYETLNLTLGSGFIEEQRWFAIAPDAVGAPGSFAVSEIARWPKSAMWLDARAKNNSKEAATQAVKWALGDDAKGADEYVNKITEYIEAAQPLAIARLAAPVSEGGGLWLDERRVVAIKLAKPDALKGQDLRAAIAKRWSDRIGAGGLLKVSFARHGDVESLSLPLLEGVGPAIAEHGGMLIISNHAGFLHDYIVAPAAPGVNAKDNAYTRVELKKSAEHISQMYQLLSERSNWGSQDVQAYFSDDAPALLDTVAGVSLMQLHGKVEGNRYVEEARYELTK